MKRKESFLDDDPLWYKDAILYELHVKTFFDGNNDGLGDFSGLTKKLDYLEWLGVNTIWLLPFYPSPLKDDGYDIADYYDIHPDYGNLKDFKSFLSEAHKRGIRVVTELVINHTSDRHEWFQKSRRATKGSAWRDYYVWSDTHARYTEARIIFQDFETSNWTWDSAAQAYFWHRFYSHQPDLNFDNENVQKAVFKVMDYWLKMGVDGLRLDAVPYLFEREGTNCENLPETHEVLKKLRSHIDKNFKNRMLLAEANQWPEDSVAYFGDGDSCHLAFHFPLMPRIFMSVQMEERFPIIDILEQTPKIPDNCQWALFLRNHDELTLEMVTDEERDYMYRVYATDHNARINLGIRRRLAPLLGNDRRKIELMNVLLFSLPGTPVIYYGDEIGMGDNYYLGDRNGVRTPMQWSGDRNAGFSKANPQKLYLPAIIDPDYHYEAINVENQERNMESLLWWMKRLVALRKRFKAFGRGSIEFLLPENPKVLAFIRQYKEENILVLVNLSRYPQMVELDLSRFAGYIPEEMFGRNRFPAIKNSPYLLSLGSHGYYFFLLCCKEDAVQIDKKEAKREISVKDNWFNVLTGRMKKRLEEEILPAFLMRSRWFGGKARKIHNTKIVEDIPLGKNDSLTRLLFLEVRYTEGLSEVYMLPLSFLEGNKAIEMIETNPGSLIARLRVESGKGIDAAIESSLPDDVLSRIRIGSIQGILYDAVYDRKFQSALFYMIVKKQRLKGLYGTLYATHGKSFKSLKKQLISEDSQVLRAEQSNTSILYDNKLFLKLYRRLEPGMNPDLEIGKLLTEEVSFLNVPPFAAAIEYEKQSSDTVFAGLVQGYVINQGDAWTFTLDEIERYFERVLSMPGEMTNQPAMSTSILDIAYEKTNLVLHDLIGGFYFEKAVLLGMRTAQLHLALSSDRGDPDFTAEPYTALYQRSIYQSFRSNTRKVFQLLKKVLKNLPESVMDKAEAILQLEEKIIEGYKPLLDKKIGAMKIRIHGDYHLGQVLYTGNDFIIIDFEGEPARALSERRLKRSPFIDVAGMIRSFHYAAYSGLHTQTSNKLGEFKDLEPWADLWYRYAGGAFLRSYLKTMNESPLIPEDKEEIRFLINAFLMEKAVYELGYELNNRPDWVTIPIKGIEQLVNK